MCGEVVLTVTSGTITERRHEHPKRGGLIQEVFSVRFSDITLVDPEGNPYRGVGASGGHFTFDPSIAEENGFGQFFINVNIVGEGGLLGTARERFQLKRNGREVEKSTGSCELPE